MLWLSSRPAPYLGFDLLDAGGLLGARDRPPMATIRVARGPLAGVGELEDPDERTPGVRGGRGRGHAEIS